MQNVSINNLVKF